MTILANIARSLILLVASQLWLVWCQTDPCTQNNEIGNPKRSSAYNTAATDVAICDYYTVKEDAWYSFKTYETFVRIPESPGTQIYALGRCGTKQPIWIQGTDQHPSDNTTVLATVCSTIGIGCDWSANITIQRCDVGGGEYFVYRLKRPPGCPMAYCAGDNPPCPPGEVYNIGMGRCVDNHPPMLGLPTFSGPLVYKNTTLDYFTFACRPNYTRNESRDNARFKVTFLFDGVKDSFKDKSSHVLAVPEYHVTDVAELEDKYLRGRLGKWISCMVQSYWEGRQHNLSSNLTSTDRYWAGIIVDGSVPLILSTSQPVGHVTLLSTVPVMCPNITYYQICRFGITINSSVKAGNCMYSIHPQHYTQFSGIEDPLYTNSNRIDVTSVSLLSAEHTTSDVKFLPMVPYDMDVLQFFPIWRGYQVDPMQVEVKRSSGSYCKVYFDPDISPFDFQREESWRTSRWIFRWSYRCSYTGDFTFWKSDDGRLAEVQLSFWNEPLEWGRIHVGVCGVAVREGNHILGLTMCRSPKIGNRYDLRPIEYLSEENGRRGVIKRSGQEYTIVMPSGTKVVIENHDNYVYVYVYPLDIDRGRSTGLCGNYNGNWTDDSTSCEQFRIPASESYFAGPASCKNYSAPIAPPCDCVNPNTDNQLVECNTTVVMDRSQHVCGGGRRKRSITEVNYYDDVMDDSDIFYTMEQTNPPPLPDWPTASGINETEARSQCQRVLMSSPVYSQCQSLVNVSDLVENCVMDVRAGDSFDVTINYPYVMETMCKLEIEASITITSTDPKVIDEQRSELNELTKQICPKHCSGNGDCVEGACRCQKGFTKNDCSLDTTLLPSIVLLRNNGICDRRKKPCMRVKLYAANLDDSRTIFCRVTSKDGFGIKISFTTPATIVSDLEIVCDLPMSPVLPDGPSSKLPTMASITYTLSISNNGVDYSSSVLMTVFDSQSCVNCHNAENCTLKGGTCVDRGICYAEGERGNDPCKICKPSEGPGLVKDKDIQVPKLVGGTSIMKQMGYKRVFKFEATSQYNISVTFQFQENIPGITLLSDGSLVWDKSANKNATATLILRNQCGLSSTLNILFSVVNSAWSPWTLWSECSHDCDYGIQTRVRDCIANSGCPNHKIEEEKLCLLSQCQAFPEEDSHGFTLEVLEIYLTQVLNKEKALFQSVAEIINGFCSTKTETCCTYHGFSSVLFSRPMTIASWEDSSFAAGYPLVENSKAMAKIVTKVSRSSFDRQCTSGTRVKREAESDVVYIDYRVLTESAEATRNKLEEAIGVPILSVKTGGSAGPIDDPKKGGLHVGAIAGIAIAICLVIAGVIVFIWVKKNFKKSPEKKYFTSQISFQPENCQEEKPSRVASGRNPRPPAATAYPVEAWK